MNNRHRETIDEAGAAQEFVKHYARREASRLILSAVEQIRTVLNQLANDCHEVYSDACEHLDVLEAEHEEDQHHRNGARS